MFVHRQIYSCGASLIHKVSKIDTKKWVFGTKGYLKNGKALYFLFHPSPTGDKIKMITSKINTSSPLLANKTDEGVKPDGKFKKKITIN